MSALPKHQLPVQQPEAEVIYVVVPSVPAIQPRVANPYTLAERVSLFFYNARFSTRAAGDKSLALAFALLVTAVGGFWAYNVKSAFGIDIFPHQHVENFAPVPGWQR